MRSLLLFMLVTVFASAVVARAEDSNGLQLTTLDLTADPAVSQTPAETEAGTMDVCVDCLANQLGIGQTAIEIAKVAKTEARPRPQPTRFQPYARSRGKEIEPSCRRVIDGGGNYGDVGRQIASLIRTRFAGSYLDGYSLRRVCPRYSSLSDDMKVKAWVWFWMVLANEESGCNPNLYHPTHYPDGRVLNPQPGWGMWAAELLPQSRAGRGPLCRGNIKTVSLQVSCAVQTMASQLQRTDSVYSSGSYWGPVRRFGDQILPNMREFKPCF